MSSPLHGDPSILSVDMPKPSKGDRGPTLRSKPMEVQTGIFNPPDKHDTNVRNLGRKTPQTPGDDHSSEVTDLDSADLDSTREDSPGIDIAKLPKTPIGAKSTTIRTDDRLNLKLAFKPANTATGLVQSLALVDAKEELCMSSAEWLRFQQEIIRFLGSAEWLYESCREAAYAFLEGTGANERFFGMLAGGEAEGLLVNRGGLAWDLDNDRIIGLVATVVAAWKDAPAHSDGDTEEDAVEERTPPIETDRHVRQTEKRPQLMPQVIAMLPRDIIDEFTAVFPVKRTRKRTNSSDEDDEDDEDSTLFVAQRRISAKRKRQIIESDDEHDDDEKINPKGLQPTSEGNKRHCGATETHTSSFTAGTTVSVRDPGPQLFFNRAWPTLIGDTLTGPQMWRNPKPCLPAPWMPSTLHIHGVQRGSMKLLSLNSILTLDGFLFQFRNAFHEEMSNSTVTNKCQIVRRIRVYQNLLFDANGLRIDGKDAHLWKETMEKMRKKIVAKEFGRISGSVEVHF